MSYMGDPDYAIKAALMPGIYGGGQEAGALTGEETGALATGGVTGGMDLPASDPMLMQLANDNAQRRAQSVSQGLQASNQQQSDNQSNLTNVAQDVLERYMEGSGANSAGYGTAESLLATTPEMMAGGGTFAGATPTFGMAGYGGASQLANLGMASSAGGNSFLGGLGANAAFQSGAMAPVTTTGGSILSGGGITGAGAAGASGVGGAGGAGGGAAAAGGVGLGAIAGIGGAILAGMHMENNRGVNTWGDQLTDFGGSNSRRADMLDADMEKVFGDNLFGDNFGNLVGSPGKVFSGRPREMWDGFKEATIEPLTLWGILDPTDWF